jgi:hypothetical protein
MEPWLDDPHPGVRRAAACLFARVYAGDPERGRRLDRLLGDGAHVLQALADAEVVSDWGWTSEQDEAITAIAEWIRAQPGDVQPAHIDNLVTALEKELAVLAPGGNGRPGEDAVADGVESGWPLRQILAGILAKLSDRLTPTAFTHARSLDAMVSLLARASQDANTYMVRKFAIGVLGNLQRFTVDVANVFFQACQDVREVYEATRAAVSNFKDFRPGSLERLVQAVRHDSATVAYHATLLLGELALTRCEDLGADARQGIAQELYQVLQDPASQRVVYDFKDSTRGKPIGPLSDFLYNALWKVVSGEAFEELPAPAGAARP